MQTYCYIQSPSQVRQGAAIHFPGPNVACQVLRVLWALLSSSMLLMTGIHLGRWNREMKRWDEDVNITTLFGWPNKKANTLSLSINSQKHVGLIIFSLSYSFVWERCWWLVLFLGIFNSLVQRFKLFVMIGSVGHDEVCIKSMSQFMSNLCWVTLRQNYVQCNLRNVPRVSVGFCYLWKK